MNSIDLLTLQTEVSQWVDKNFPGQSAHQPLLGIMEEVGELAHSHLKQEQRIRGTYHKHQEGKEDAVADILIYLANYCNKNGIVLDSVIARVWNEVKQRDWTKNKKDGAA